MNNLQKHYVGKVMEGLVYLLILCTAGMFLLKTTEFAKNQILAIATVITVACSFALNRWVFKQWAFALPNLSKEETIVKYKISMGIFLFLAVVCAVIINGATNKVLFFLGFGALAILAYREYRQLIKPNEPVEEKVVTEDGEL